jgi:hypothetical protein
MFVVPTIPKMQQPKAEQHDYSESIRNRSFRVHPQTRFWSRMHLISAMERNDYAVEMLECGQYFKALIALQDALRYFQQSVQVQSETSTACSPKASTTEQVAGTENADVDRGCNHTTAGSSSTDSETVPGRNISFGTPSKTRLCYSHEESRCVSVHNVENQQSKNAEQASRRTSLIRTSSVPQPEDCESPLFANKFSFFCRAFAVQIHHSSTFSQNDNVDEDLVADGDLGLTLIYNLAFTHHRMGLKGTMTKLQQKGVFPFIRQHLTQALILYGLARDLISEHCGQLGNSRIDSIHPVLQLALFNNEIHAWQTLHGADFDLSVKAVPLFSSLVTSISSNVSIQVSVKDIVFFTKNLQVLQNPFCSTAPGA